MALPSRTDLLSMDFFHEMNPYVGDDLDLVYNTEYTLEAQPFVVNQVPPAPPVTQKARITTYIWGN